METPGVLVGLDFIKKHTQLSEPIEDEQIKGNLLRQNANEIKRNPILEQTIKQYGGRELSKAIENDPHGNILKTLNTFETVKSLVHQDKFNEAQMLIQNADPVVQNGLSQMLAITWNQILEPKDSEVTKTVYSSLANSVRASRETRQEGRKYLAMKAAYDEIVDEERMSSGTSPEALLRSRRAQGQDASSAKIKESSGYFP